MNEIKIRKFLDKKFKETSEEENFCYEEILLIYKIKINNFVNEVKIQKIFYLKTLYKTANNKKIKATYSVNFSIPSFS